MPRFRALPSCLLAALLAASSMAVAGPQGHRQGPPESAASRNDALSDSVRRVERNTRAQVLSAERVPFDGRDVNRIKTVDDRGRVRVFMDDPQQPPAPPEAPTRGNDD